jgi:hypothetical protein
MPTLTEALRQLGRHWRRQATDIVPARVMGRNTDGTVNLQRYDGTCTSRGEVSSHYTGQIVSEVPKPAYNRTGAAGVAQISSSQSVGTLWVESIDPDEYEQGLSYSVTVIGKGFTSTTEFAFLQLGSDEINEDITIDSKTLVSATEYTLEITVAADADAVSAAPLAYDDPGNPYL